jgi:hypothetical protein
VRAPELVTPGPSFAELFAEGCFAARPLMDGGALSRAAYARGLSLPSQHRREILERLDREGALWPVGFLQINYTPEATWLHPRPELMRWREEGHPEPWQTHAWDVDGFEVSERYSPWQLLYLGDALAGAHVTIPAAELLRATGPSDLVVRAARYRLDEHRQLDEHWRPLVKLLAAVQPRFWGLRSGWSKQVSTETESGLVSVNTADHAVETFDPWAILRRFELSLDDLARLHLELAEASVALDPLAGWYRVASFAPRDSSDRLRGAALRARDLYDAGFLLRGTYHLATGRWLPEPDELEGARSPEGFLTVSGQKRRHLPRVDDRPRRSRLDLKDSLVRLGLYPHLMHFFVEGDTEEIVLRKLLDFLGYDLETGSVSITNFRGIDKADRYQTLLSSVNRYAARTLLVADHEGEIERTLRRLREAGALLDPENVILWEREGRASSFEEVNFSSAELLKAIEAAGRRREPSARLTLTPATLEAEFEAQRADAERNGRQPPGFAEVARRLAGRQAYGAVSVGKKDFAPDLAETLKQTVRTAGHIADAGSERPLLARLWTWIVDTKRPGPGRSV